MWNVCALSSILTSRLNSNPVLYFCVVRSDLEFKCSWPIFSHFLNRSVLGPDTGRSFNKSINEEDFPIQAFLNSV